MKQNLLLLLLLFTLNVFAQDSRFSVEINYPIPFGENFVSDTYNGIIDIGVNYKGYSTKTLNLGLAFNAGLLTSDNNVIDLDIKSYVIQPKLVIEFNVSRFHPYLRLGYSFMVFKTKSIDDRYRFGGISLNNTQSGLNINPGLKYNINNDFFIQAQFDYIYLSSKGSIIRTIYNNTVHIIKIGLGIYL